MMDYDAQLKLQAYLDGELPEGEAAEVKAWVAGDRDAQQLLAELQITNAALAGHEAEIKLPESREFFWSKIQREIQRSEAAPAPAPKVSWFAWWRGKLVPLGGVAVMALSLLLLFMSPGNPQNPQFAGEMELASDNDMQVVTIRDQEQDTTTVWFSDRADDSQSAEPTPAATAPTP